LSGTARVCLAALLCVAGTSTGALIPGARAQLASRLHASMLETFNRNGVQITSPNYHHDLVRPKIVAEAHGYGAPARKPDEGQTPRGT
jgi:hypothetical protein